MPTDVRTGPSLPGPERSRRILYVQYTNPAAYPPIEHSALLLAAAGFDVLVSGTRDPNDPLEFKHHERITQFSLPLAAAGWRRRFHYLGFAASLAARTRRWRPDWIYASDPLSCPIALLVAGTSGARLIYHEHDSPDEVTVSRSFFMRLILAARRRVATRADLCVLPNSARTDAFRRVHPVSRSVTVWNCPSHDEVRHLERPAASDELRVLYHGSIVPARLPITVIDALAKLPSMVRLVVAGYETAGYPGYLDALRQRASELGIAHRIEFVGTVTERADLLRQCARCDVGLALMPLVPADLNEREMVGASNKPFDYMACGLALVVSDLPSWRTTFVDSGYALACNPDSVESIASVLRRLLETPQLRLTIGKLGRKKILDDWNYERLFAPVLALLTADTEMTARTAGAGVAPAQAVRQ